MNDSFSSFLNSSKMRTTILAVLIVLGLYLLAQTATLTSNLGRSGVPATDTITVQADGKATVAPDVARVSFSVQNTAATVADAQAATTKQANAAIDYVKGQKIDEKDIRTLSYNISPQYSYANPCTAGEMCPDYIRSPKITGYQVSETIQVTVRDLENVGTLLGGLGKLEVQNVDGPNFGLDDSTAGYEAARADAIAQAKQQAALLAKQLGVHLGKIVNFTESSGGYAYPMMYASAGMAVKDAAAPTPTVPTGENTYNASVTITYEIR